MKKASFLVIVLFLISVWPVGAQTLPAGYFKHGDFYCNSDTNFEKPWSALGRKFCQPQVTGCRAIGGKFCTAGTRNVCCPTNNACGKGTALGFFEVAVCVPPTPVGATCTTSSPGYVGRTKDGQNVCCRIDQELGPAGGKAAPICQPKSRSACASGEQFVQGTGENQGSKWCCPNNTAPAHHPNGLPFCARLPLTVLAPNGGEQISKSGPPYRVKWSTNNIPSVQPIKLRLLNSSGGVAYQNNLPNTGSTDFNFSSSSFSPGQYKIELSVTVSGQTITDQSDNFFTLTGSNPPPPPPHTPPPPPPDTTPPTISLGGSLGLGVPFSPNKDTTVIFYANDLTPTNGLAYITIVVKAPQAATPLMKTCDHTIFHPTYAACWLTVPANQWVTGTTILVSAIDYSPNRNIALEGYKIVPSGQLQGD